MKDKAGVTVRSVLIGILFTLLCTVMGHYSINVVGGSYMSIDHMPVAGISLFFFLLLCLHIVITIVKKPLGLSRAELLVIYIMGFVGCSVATMGLGSQILPILGAPSYFASAENGWAELIQPHMKGWMIPQDEKAVAAFFEGARGAPIPWGVWVKPLLYWLPFVLALYVVMICTAIIMRRQWIDRERLQFPLAQLPLEMVRKEEGTGRSPFFTNKLMWLGFAIPVIICTINGLNAYFPGVPAIALARQVFTFRGTQALNFRVSFPMIGFLFLVNLDVAFSLWFFASA